MGSEGRCDDAPSPEGGDWVCFLEQGGASEAAQAVREAIAAVGGAPRLTTLRVQFARLGRLVPQRALAPSECSGGLEGVASPAFFTADHVARVALEGHAFTGPEPVPLQGVIGAVRVNPVERVTGSVREVREVSVEATVVVALEDQIVRAQAVLPTQDHPTHEMHCGEPLEPDVGIVSDVVADLREQPVQGVDAIGADLRDRGQGAPGLPRPRLGRSVDLWSTAGAASQRREVGDDGWALLFEHRKHPE